MIRFYKCKISAGVSEWKTKVLGLIKQDQSWHKWKEEEEIACQLAASIYGTSWLQEEFRLERLF